MHPISCTYHWLDLMVFGAHDFNQSLQRALRANLSPCLQTALKLSPRHAGDGGGGLGWQKNTTPQDAGSHKQNQGILGI